MILSCVAISVATSVSDPVTSWPSLSVASVLSPLRPTLCTALLRLEVGIRPSEPAFHPSPGAWLLCQEHRGGNLSVWEVLGHESSRDGHGRRDRGREGSLSEDLRQAGGWGVQVLHPEQTRTRGLGGQKRSVRDEG